MVQKATHGRSENPRESTEYRFMKRGLYDAEPLRPDLGQAQPEDRCEDPREITRVQIHETRALRRRTRTGICPLRPDLGRP